MGGSRDDARARVWGARTTGLQENKIKTSVQAEIAKKPFVSLTILLKIPQRQVLSGPVSSRKTDVPRTTHNLPHKFKKSRLQEQARLSDKNYETLPV